MNLPNKLSVFRLVLVPVFVAVYFAPFEGSRYVAAFVFLTAGLTDVADGYIARRYDMVTPLGRVLDPLADKSLQVSAFLCLYASGRIEIWVALLFIVKELFMVAGGATIYRKMKDVPSANIPGKVASLLIFILVLVVIVRSDIDKTATTVCFLAVFSAAVAAFIIYLFLYRSTIKALKSGNDKDSRS